MCLQVQIQFQKQQPVQTVQTDSSDNVESNPLIPYVLNQNKNGINLDPTSDPSNPLVYYGETIDQYPFYKYTMISNLKAVKKQAEKNTAAIQEWNSSI